MERDVSKKRTKKKSKKDFTKQKDSRKKKEFETCRMKKLEKQRSVLKELEIRRLAKIKSRIKF